MWPQSLTLEEEVGEDLLVLGKVVVAPFFSLEYGGPEEGFWEAGAAFLQRAAHAQESVLVEGQAAVVQVDTVLKMEYWSLVRLNSELSPISSQVLSQV